MDASARAKASRPEVGAVTREDKEAVQELVLAQRDVFTGLRANGKKMPPKKLDHALKITCHLVTPIAGDVPHLCAIAEWEMAQREGKAEKIQRHQTAPPYGEIHIPMLRRNIGGVLVPCCSSPICSPDHETVEHFAKRLAVEHSDLLAADKRRIVATGNSTYKAYRLPLHVRACDKIVWFCKGDRRPMKKLLQSVHSLGKKRSYGYGRVGRWELEWIDDDWSWYAPSDNGPVLMRPLPLCSELPTNLVGSRPDFGAVQPPMWHPDRYMERVIPC